MSYEKLDKIAKHFEKKIKGAGSKEEKQKYGRILGATLKKKKEMEKNEHCK